MTTEYILRKECGNCGTINNQNNLRCRGCNELMVTEIKKPIGYKAIEE